MPDKVDFTVQIKTCHKLIHFKLSIFSVSRHVVDVFSSVQELINVVYYVKFKVIVVMSLKKQFFWVVVLC